MDTPCVSLSNLLVASWAPGSPLRLCWVPSGHPWARFRDSGVSLCALAGPRWRLWGRFSGPLARPWGLFGFFLGSLGPPGASLGPLLGCPWPHCPAQGLWDRAHAPMARPRAHGAGPMDPWPGPGPIGLGPWDWAHGPMAWPRALETGPMDPGPGATTAAATAAEEFPPTSSPPSQICLIRFN